MNELDLVRAFRNQVPEPDERTREAARARITRQRTVRRSRWLIATVAAVIAGSATASGLALSGYVSGLFDGTPVPTDQLAPADRFVLSASDARSPLVELIATREGQAFYVISRANGGPCYASGAVGRPLRLAVTMCPRPGNSLSFPSAEQPILDQSGYVASATGSIPQLVRLAGFAADPVARIGVVDDEGQVAYSVPVIDNVYVDVTRAPMSVRAIVAFDTSGHELFRDCAQAAGCKD